MKKAPAQKPTPPEKNNDIVKNQIVTQPAIEKPAFQ